MSESDDKRNAFGELLAEIIGQDDLMLVRALINGIVQWENVEDELGRDVETGNPIPYGATQA